MKEQRKCKEGVSEQTLSCGAQQQLGGATHAAPPLLVHQAPGPLCLCRSCLDAIKALRDVYKPYLPSSVKAGGTSDLGSAKKKSEAAQSARESSVAGTAQSLVSHHITHTARVGLVWGSAMRVPLESPHTPRPPPSPCCRPGSRRPPTWTGPLTSPPPHPPPPLAAGPAPGGRPPGLGRLPQVRGVRHQRGAGAWLTAPGRDQAPG